MRDRRLALVSALLAAAVSAGSALAAPQPGPWPGPTVYSGTRAGPVAVTKGPDFGIIASLAVPSGRWVAFAKLELSPTNPNGATPTCKLVGGGSEFGASYQSGKTGMWGEDGVGVGTPSGSISFNVAHTFARVGGAFQLSCMANGPGVTARHVRIMAVRAGTLTTMVVGGASRVTTGSGKPEVFHAYRHTSVVIPTTNSYAKIAGLRLPAGEWWIRADFAMRRNGGDSPVPIACRLTAGGETDLLHAEMEGPGFPLREAMFDFNVAASIATRTGDQVLISCRTSDSSMEADEIHITAIKAGVLTKVSLTTGSSETTGGGKPAVVHARRIFVPALTESYQSVGAITLGAGKWMAIAKASTVDGNSVRCRLFDGVDFDESAERQLTNGRSIALQTASVASSRHSLSIACRALAPAHVEGAGSRVEYIKITAVQLGALVVKTI